MNRRADERIEMRLTCHLIFPDLWQGSIAGSTANLHRNGVLVECGLDSLSQQIPSIGERAHVRIELPEHPAFGPKCIDCEGTLIRTRRSTAGEWQFALRIGEVSFSERPAMVLGGSGSSDTDSCRYLT